MLPNNNDTLVGPESCWLTAVSLFGMRDSTAKGACCPPGFCQLQGCDTSFALVWFDDSSLKFKAFHQPAGHSCHSCLPNKFLGCPPTHLGWLLWPSLACSPSAPGCWPCCCLHSRSSSDSTGTSSLCMTPLSNAAPGAPFLLKPSRILSCFFFKPSLA